MEKFGRETREYMFNELKESLRKHPNMFVASFSNLKVTDLQALRTALKGVSSGYTVVKNTIALRVLKELDRDDACGMINGMCGLVFAGDDIVAASKALVDFKKDHDTLDINGGMLNGSVVSFDLIKELSQLPPRQVLLGMAVSGMYSPVTGFVNSLSGLIRKFVYVINAIKEKGGKQDG